MAETCYFCRGTIEQRNVDVDFRWGRKLKMIRSVPAGVCRQCGERYFDSKIMHQMDLLAQPIIKRAKRPSKKPLAVIDFAAQGVLEPAVALKR